MAVSGLARSASPAGGTSVAWSSPLWPLLPVSWLFGVLVRLRRGLYRCGVLRTDHLPVPVVVVGNLTVGGSGKTPLVLWLVSRLRDQRLVPGHHQSRLRWIWRAGACRYCLPRLARWSVTSP
jgi:hypothetical protein